MKTYPGFWLICILLCCSQVLRAQLTVANGSTMGMTPSQLVQNWLVGSGVVISNVTYNGSSAIITSDQVGSFNASGPAFTQLGLDAGLIMTNGMASIAIGPNTVPGAGADTGGPGDPDLSVLAGGVTYDKAVIEFDFVPVSDTIKFNYVFGSEEFYEFCYQFNDAFGFFLSGPGISGPYSNNSIDIALMPGTANPVTINNICANSSSAWNNAGGQWFQYDALSYVFTARHAVVPCSTYHIKLAIADALDHILDAGVFLKKGSFASSNVTPTVTYQIGNHAIEGCADATIHFMLDAPIGKADTILLSIGGTATNCVDYSCLPSSVIIPAGQTSANLVIHALSDSLTEGTETVIIGIQTQGCSTVQQQSDTVFIADYLPMTLLASNDTIICAGNQVTLQVAPQGGEPVYHYLWNTGATTASFTATPAPGLNLYTVAVTDTCDHTKADTIRVTASLPGQPFIKGNNNACVGAGFNFYTTEAGMNNYTWAISAGGMINSGQGTYRVQVTWAAPGNRWVSVSYSNPYGCSGLSTTTFPVMVFPFPGTPGNIQGDSLFCAGSTGTHFTISPVQYATGYDWTVPPGTSIISGNGTSDILVSFGTGALSGDILVNGSNGCGQGPPSPAFPVKVFASPVANAGPDLTACQGMPFTVTQATASNYNIIYWISDGHGALTGSTTLSPSYFPDQSDTGAVTLTLIATGKAPCENDTSRLALRSIRRAAVYAGSNLTTCENTPVALAEAVATHVETLVWNSTGNGTFDDPFSLHPVYTPGADDILQGSATLTLTVTAAAPCPGDSSAVLLQINRSPSVNAGPQPGSCGDSPVTLAGSTASNYLSLKWTTNGNGSFDDATVLHPTYKPGQDDLLNGQALLTLHAPATGPCRDDSSAVLLTIAAPAIVNAGPGEVTCRDTPFTVSGASASSSNRVTWTHNGNGTLTGANTLTPVYTPCSSDPPSVTLTMTVDPQPPCPEVSASMQLTIGELPAVNAGPDQMIKKGTSTMLTATASGGSGQYSYEWRPAGLLTEFRVKDPETVTMMADTTFVLWVTDRLTGCRNTDTVAVKVVSLEPVNDCLRFYNVITPNGDGLNDTWIIDCIDRFPGNTVTIFNRWGDEVNTFRGYNNTSVVWKGTGKNNEPLPGGTYFYIFSSPGGGTRTGWVYIR
ncbi:MAG: choice-of-anchor L domain-containing protein [Bacteroidota bacterium]